MFQMLPFIFNGMFNGMMNNNYNNGWNMNNNNWNMNNNYNNWNQNNNYNNGWNGNNNLNLEDTFANTFNTVFTQVFSTLINNTDLIDDIVDSVINSDVVASMMDEIDGLGEIDFKITNYNDKYLIDGVLPGIDKKSIDIDYENERVLIKVKKSQVFSNGVNTMVAFVQPGENIEKSFYVPGVDKEQIRATYRDNNLKIYLPKKTKEEEATIIDVDDFTESK